MGTILNILRSVAIPVTTLLAQEIVGHLITPNKGKPYVRRNTTRRNGFYKNPTTKK